MRKYVLFGAIAFLVAILWGSALLMVPQKKLEMTAPFSYDGGGVYYSSGSEECGDDNVCIAEHQRARRECTLDPSRCLGSSNEITRLQTQSQNDLQIGPSPNNELVKMGELGRKTERLPKGKIYLDAPIEMKVGDKRVVDARVGINVPDNVLRGHVRAGDQTIPGTLLVSHEMIATLSGPGFAITRTTPEKQTVANGFPTVWQWDVEAKQDGSQELEATLYALVPERERVDSYTQTITVTVNPLTWGDWVKSAGEEISAIKAIVLSLGAIAAAILSWFGISRRQGRRSPTIARVRKPRTAKPSGSGVVSRRCESAMLYER